MSIILPFIKLSFFLMYLQIFRPMKWLRYGAYIGAVVNVLFYLCILIVTLVLTVPAPGQTWQEAIQTNRSVHSVTVAMYSSSGSLLLDIYILVLPVAGVSKLKLTAKRKLGVIAIFLTGGM